MKHYSEAARNAIAKRAGVTRATVDAYLAGQPLRPAVAAAVKAAIR